MELTSAKAKYLSELGYRELEYPFYRGHMFGVPHLILCVATHKGHLKMKPTINSISPSTGPSGSLAKINGSGFGGTQGNSTVTVDGVIVKPTSWSDTAIAITLPQSAPHDAQIVVNVGGDESNAVAFNQRAA